MPRTSIPDSLKKKAISVSLSPLVLGEIEKSYNKSRVVDDAVRSALNIRAVLLLRKEGRIDSNLAISEIEKQINSWETNFQL